MEEITKWIKQNTSNAKFFLTLNFNYDVCSEHVENMAKEFQKRVSVGVSGNKARKGLYRHKMFIVREQQKHSRRWHLHILMDDIPAQFYQRAIERGVGLQSICSKAWNSMQGTGKTNIVGRESITFVNGTPNFNCEWFKPITNLEKLSMYIVKTFDYQGSNFLVVT